MVKSRKWALVTGASKGIGQAISGELARSGWNVIIHYKSDRNGAEVTAEMVRSFGAQATLVQGDLGISANVSRMFDEVNRGCGALHAVVNNAGINIPPTSISALAEDDFDKIMQANVKSALFCMQQAAQRLENQGRIVNVTTSLCRLPRASYGAYIASKSAVEALTRVLAKELGERSITVNAVAPGPVDTSLFRKNKTDEQIQAFEKLSPLNRVGAPAEIGRVVAFLASDESSWINGQIIPVNGGMI